VSVQEVRWDKGDSEPADGYAFFCGNENANHHLQSGFSIHKGIRLAVKRVMFISDRMSYI
jgi:hypothetical protein